jgi:TrmH family RNA methyltransferase
MTCDTALIIGNEGNGMSEEFHSLTDENVMIPMEGEIESLNAAVAAGIIMYNSVKRFSE